MPVVMQTDRQGAHRKVRHRSSDTHKASSLMHHGDSIRWQASSHMHHDCSIGGAVVVCPDIFNSQ